MRIRPGQIAVVTGAAHGIGKALVSRLVAAGVKVVMADVDAEALHVAQNELAFFGADVLAVPTDVTDLTDVRRLRDLTQRHFGRVDLVFNSAGVTGPTRPVWELDTREWRRTFDANLDGVCTTHKVFVPELITRGRGHVINIASAIGLSAVPRTGDHAVGRHAVVSLTETLRAELATCAPKVGVTLVCPGLIRNQMLKGHNDLHETVTSLTDVAHAIVQAVDGDQSRVLPNSLMTAA